MKNILKRILGGVMLIGLVLLLLWSIGISVIDGLKAITFIIGVVVWTLSALFSFGLLFGKI